MQKVQNKKKDHILECVMSVSHWMLVGTNTKGMVDLGSLEGKRKKSDKEGERPATEHQKGSALVGSPRLGKGV